jgi:hypothetical protein
LAFVLSSQVLAWNAFLVSLKQANLPFAHRDCSDAWDHFTQSSLYNILYHLSICSQWMLLIGFPSILWVVSLLVF